MIAKVIASGPDRASAVRSMQAALDGFYIRGPRTNVAFLASVARTDRFRDGDLDTGFLEAEYPEGHQPVQPTGTVREALIAAAVFVDRAEAIRTGGPSAPAEIDRVLVLGEETVPYSIQTVDGGHDLTIGGQQLAVRSTWAPGEPVFVGQVNARTVAVQVDRAFEGWTLTHGGVTVPVLVRSLEAAALAVHMPTKVPPDRSNELSSPMPGLVLSISVREGEEVRVGQAVAIVEAMKAENVLRADRDGIVQRVAVREGDNIAADDVIVEFA